MGLISSRLIPIGLFALAFGSAGRADIIEDISLNTSPLIGESAGPFSLDFQFIDGSGTGDANNTVTLSNFLFGSGTPNGSPSLNGGVTGSLSSTVTLTDSSFFNQFVGGFTPGNALQFQLSMTTNIDGGGTPDEFTFAILDSSGVEIPTQAGAPLDYFLAINIDSANPTAQTYASDPTRTPAAGGGPITMEAPQVIPVTATPEPSFLSLLALSFVLTLVWRKRVACCTPRL